MLYSLVYVSSATKPFSVDELRTLLERTRANNTRRSISGMLLYKDGNFMQALEGEEATVKGVYGTIAQDPRHTGAIMLLKGPIETRAFAEWSMGFRDLRADTAGVEGYSAFLNTPLTSAEFLAEPSRAQKLLLMFKQKM